MNRGRAREVVRQIFMVAGYDVTEVEEHFDLSAVRGDDCVIILCSDSPIEIEAFDQTHFHVELETGRQECIKILFSLNDSVTTSRCIRWGRTQLAAYAGRAAVSSVFDEPFNLEFGIPTEKVVPAGEPGRLLRHIPPRISKEQAVTISGSKGRVSIRFIPHWHYHYKSSGEKVFKDRVVSFDAAGSGALNAINGIESEDDAGMVVNTAIPLEARVIEAVIDEEEAREKITEEIIRSLTRGVRIRLEEGDTLAFEDRVLKPDRKNITVDLSLFYVPVWEIRGNKIIEVNGVTGEILSHPMDNGVEIL